MSYVSRSEFDQLERRCKRNDNDLRMQMAQMKIMNAKLDAMGMGAAMGGMGMDAWGGKGAWGGAGGWGPMWDDMMGGKGGKGSKGGSPYGGGGKGGGGGGGGGRKPHLPRPPSGTDLQSTEEFAAESGLDEKCLQVLLSQSEEVQHYVIGLGPATGRNPSAMVMSRIAKASTEFTLSYDSDKYSAFSGEPMGDKVEEFLQTNNLDEKCGEALRGQTPECQAAVLSQGPAEGRNPNAMVMGRIAKFTRGR